MRLTRALAVLSCLLLGCVNSAFADKIVLANDEWQTANAGFSNTPAGSEQFALNVAKFFTGDSGTFLIVSDNFSLDEDEATSLRAIMTGAGYGWVDSENLPGFTLDLATLLSYDGVFFALPPSVSQTVLVDYVNAGGNVYINGGTGIGGSVSEAAAWNTFLNTFGLNFSSTYNGIGGNVAIASSSPVLAGVSALYQNNGNSISLVGGNPYAEIIATSSGGQGLYAVYDRPVAVAEPSSLLLLAVGIGALVPKRRRA